ncbi:unnamed protein product [Durusdinium trenchii]|uniref:Uncharacterized protein n=1 Tax=Durusdinium trenchii TaxID=1381693 RepID=A0ABP0NHH9_9DINO
MAVLNVQIISILVALLHPVACGQCSGAECAAVDAANDARHSLLQTATADHVHRPVAPAAAHSEDLKEVVKSTAPHANLQINTSASHVSNSSKACGCLVQQWSSAIFTIGVLSFATWSHLCSFEAEETDWWKLCSHRHL